VPETYQLSHNGRDDTNGTVIIAVDPVPEPSTWAMLILSFAGVGIMAYCRNGRPPSGRFEPGSPPALFQ
jgi:hypothetical protein